MLAAITAFVDAGGWCALELCVDVPTQHWEPRLVICEEEPDVVAIAIARELALEHATDARIAAYDRASLRPIARLGTHLCQVAAGTTVPDFPPDPSPDPEPWRQPMLVRDGMNPIVVTVGPDHTLREASRRMTARSVGAAVVVGGDAPGPGIITERDILNSNGVGQDIDAELVRDHLTSGLVYAAVDWSLEQAAEAMVRGAFRHVIVVDGADVVGILSMRDIVRCWTSDGATCDVPGG